MMKKSMPLDRLERSLPGVKVVNPVATGTYQGTVQIPTPTSSGIATENIGYVKHFGDSPEADQAEAVSQRTADEERKAEEARKAIEKAMLSNMTNFKNAYKAAMKEVMTGEKPKPEDKKESE